LHEGRRLFLVQGEAGMRVQVATPPDKFV